MGTTLDGRRWERGQCNRSSTQLPLFGDEVEFGNILTPRQVYWAAKAARGEGSEPRTAKSLHNTRIELSEAGAGVAIFAMAATGHLNSGESAPQLRKDIR